MRVLIADDHPLMVDGLCSLLEAHGIEVAAAVGDGQAAVAEALRLEPDLVLMDLRMPGCDGLTATRLIKAQRPDMKILILTTSAETEDLFEAIRSGACGYLLKVTSGPAFIEALHGLEQGIPPFSPGLAERLLREFTRLTGESETWGRGDAGTRGRGDAETGTRGRETRDAGTWSGARGARPAVRAPDRGAATGCIRPDLQTGRGQDRPERGHSALSHGRDHEPAAPGEPQPGHRLRRQAGAGGLQRKRLASIPFK